MHELGMCYYDHTINNQHIEVTIVVATATKTRKPIMMTPSQIKLVEELSKRASEKEKRTVSFAEIVRRAVDAYEGSSNDDEELINTLLDEITNTTEETVREVKKLNQKLDRSNDAGL